METIYIETMVVSYLVANPSRDSILAAHQQLTRQWWLDERQRYVCVTSSEVLREAGLGDAEMSRRRANWRGRFWQNDCFRPPQRPMPFMRS